jgi:hypothetical protein
MILGPIDIQALIEGNAAITASNSSPACIGPILAIIPFQRALVYWSTTNFTNG